MNVKYYYNFFGKENKEYRVEILQKEPCSNPMPLTLHGTPFLLEYNDESKMAPIKSSGGTIGVLSRTAFEWIELHTDEAQKYMVKFYINKALEWVGWLDSESYSEDYSMSRNYPVDFTCSDFSVADRLKYFDVAGKPYKGISSHREIINRCLSAIGLNLPLMVKCATTANGYSSNVLDDMYVQNSNFYDEEGEAMTIREVLESVLSIYGLMIVQKKGTLYIYDYCSIDDIPTIDMADIGFGAAGGNLSYEGMINNVEITSSLYSDEELLSQSVDVDEMTNALTTTTGDKYKIETYALPEEWTGEPATIVKRWTNTDTDSTNGGIRLRHDADPVNGKYPIALKTQTAPLYLIGTDGGYMLNVKVKVYLNTKTNIFDTEMTDTSNAQGCYLKGNLYTVDDNGNMLYWFSNGLLDYGWFPASAYPMREQAFTLMYVDSNVGQGCQVNKWVTNSNAPLYPYGMLPGYPAEVPQKDIGIGVNIPLRTQSIAPGAEDVCVEGNLILELYGAYSMYNIRLSGGIVQRKDVKDVLVESVDLSIRDSAGKELELDDYVYKAFINKNVANDYDDVTLYMTSANLSKVPFGKANILDANHKIVNSFTRLGESAELEKLLLRTIYSNHNNKRYLLQTTLASSDNMILTRLTHNSSLPGRRFIVRSTIVNYADNVQEVTLMEVNKDTISLVDI